MQLALVLLKGEMQHKREWGNYMERVAKFERVSRERFVADWLDTFGGEEAEAE